MALRRRLYFAWQSGYHVNRHCRISLCPTCIANRKWGHAQIGVVKATIGVVSSVIIVAVSTVESNAAAALLSYRRMKNQLSAAAARQLIIAVVHRGNRPIYNEMVLPINKARTPKIAAARQAFHHRENGRPYVF